VRVGVVNIGGSVAVVVAHLELSPMELEDSLLPFVATSITSNSVSVGTARYLYWECTGHVTALTNLHG
jgi:hypothetical protein